MEDNTQQKKQPKTKHGSTKIDPSFKSKRYRDKLRTEVKALECLIPVDRPALHRKLDSQTVYRLVIAFLRMKNYFKTVEFVEYQETQSERFETEQTQQQAKSDQTTASSQCKKMEHKLFKEINIHELMEGFIIMMSVDGTIMYVSENVVQFNGFNQVDLIHRCVYGIIHPDDQTDVRNILEENGLHSYNRHVGMNNMRKKHKISLYEDDSTTASFFCRMKCFVGNTAGYMKLHCSGKLHGVPAVPRSSKMADRIAIMFCQPFLHNGNDVMNDSKDNVFWSKHDLDLTFRETENKVTDVLGYEEKELCDNSMYTLVHVEDLHTVVTVHKSMTEVSDVQSFFMRLKHKDDSWKWFHSKGKVISKNSKKFSIVFTHCPVRDENSVFLQQEMLLRRKHSLKDLLDLSTFRSCHGDHVTDTEDFCITEKKTPYLYPGHTLTTSHTGSHKRYRSEPLDYLRDCCESPNDEVSVILNPVTFVPIPCPSTWHSSLERHSPVVPSSHVAHKLCLKEKQLQYAQFKRTQHPLNKEAKTDNFYDMTDQALDNPQMIYDSNSQHAIRNIVQRSNRDTNTDLYRQSLYLYNAGPVLTLQSCPQYRMEQPLSAQQFVYAPSYPTEIYNYPPSPPPSPRRSAIDPVSMVTLNGGQFVTRQANKLGPYHLPTQAAIHLPEKNYLLSVGDGITNNKHHDNRPTTSSGFSHPNGLNQYQSHANIKFSMILNAASSPKDQLNIANTKLLQTHSYPNNSTPSDGIGPGQYTNQIKFEAETIQSCSSGTDSLFVQPSPDCVHYDVEASIHMKIVESELKTSQSCPEVEIPAFDSFMEYLTDEKIY